MSQKADLTIINACSYKELPDTEIMGVSAKDVQRRFGKMLRKMLAGHDQAASELAVAERAIHERLARERAADEKEPKGG